jgi:GMP synthase-like glutamine amidotransferase
MNALTSADSDDILETDAAHTRVLVIEHEADTDAGLIGAAAIAAGSTCEVVNPRVDPLPDPTDFDAIVILGSVESAYDDTIAAWFDPELAFIRAAHEHNVPMLGICFGAQAMAVALGGSVSKAPYGEYGWKVIDTHAPSVISEGPWFQWHVDAITPPPEADILASSECCVQAYSLGPHLAVQFHPEIGISHATEWPASDPDGLLASGMSATDMVSITEALLPDATDRATALWNHFQSGW